MSEVNATGPLAAADLMSLEQYARERADFRQQVLAHKKLRTLMLGEHMSWIFEDRLTIQYQVQEMLRIERIFEAAGIEAELETYNPLIPDGSNWKVTLLIEYPEVDERRVALTRLRGIEDSCYVEVEGMVRVMAIADEDLERANDEKTSAVHWLRFELTTAMIAAIRAGATVTAGTDHPASQLSVVLPPAVTTALAQDLH